MINNDDSTADTRRLPSIDRQMKVTPLDMRQMKLTTTMRGFDKAEVTQLVLEAADGYDQALRDNERLRQELIKAEAQLVQYRELESSLRNTLMSAQKVADDMRVNADSEAKRLVREAEGKVELLMERAQSRLEDVQREIDGLKLTRRETETQVQSVIAVLNHALEFIREQEGRDRQHDKVLPHRPRIEAAS
jgi:cell division initiation protein